MKYQPLTEEYKVRCLNKLGEKYKLFSELRLIVLEFNTSYDSIMSFEELVASIIVAKLSNTSLILPIIKKNLEFIFGKLSNAENLLELKLIGIDSLSSLATKYENGDESFRVSLEEFFEGFDKIKMLISIFKDQEKVNSIFYEVLTFLAKEPA